MSTYTIGELAELSGLTRRALRLYEQAGLITAGREPNGYRRYSEADLQAARVIQELRAAGLSLDAIRALFDLKRADLPVQDKLQRSLRVLDRIHDELESKRRAIERALERLDNDRREILDHLGEESA